ncbi:MAG: NAD(P)-dependent oxidoreductase [Alphaproteobacteria bacterium]|nr:NAD(P)-dependent oxidoreductase [Alphaproteobacteria bacterium]
MSTIAVLGTGLLGAGFALQLLDQGHTVHVWNRTAAKTAPLVEAGAQAFDDPAAAVAGADRVHLVLTDDAVVEQVVAAARAGLSPDTWVVDHSTCLPAATAARTARLRADGVRYVHAPVFMSPRDSRGATGLMLLAASQADADALTPALSTMTGKVWHVGERPDLAAVHKLNGNGMLVGMAGIMGDLFTIGAQHDLDPDQVLALFDVFRAGGALGFIGKRVANAEQMDASFELTMARKDVRLMIEAAGGPEGLSVLPGVADAMDAGIAAGKGSKDFAVFAGRR